MSPVAPQPFLDGVSALTWLDGLFPEGGVQSWPEFSSQKGEELGVQGSTGSPISEHLNPP